MNIVEELAKYLYVESLENESEEFRDFSMKDGVEGAWKGLTGDGQSQYLEEAEGIIHLISGFLEDIETKGYELGIVAGVMDSALFLEDEAIDKWKARNEKDANVIRNLADKLMERQKVKRGIYDSKYPK